jgi:cell division protein FtsB
LRARFVIGSVLLIGAAYFAVFGGDYDIFDLRRIRHERAIEEARLEEERAALELQSARRDSLANDPATLERLARERFGLIRDGETLYRFADSSAAAPPDAGAARD